MAVPAQAGSIYLMANPESEKLALYYNHKVPRVLPI